MIERGDMSVQTKTGLWQSDHAGNSLSLSLVYLLQTWGPRSQPIKELYSKTTFNVLAFPPLSIRARGARLSLVCALSGKVQAIRFENSNQNLVTLI